MLSTFVESIDLRRRHEETVSVGFTPNQTEALTQVDDLFTWSVPPAGWNARQVWRQTPGALVVHSIA
jgi:hypothetical protein